MGKSESEEKIEKLLNKKLDFNRVEIRFNNKSILIEYLTPKKAVEQAIAYLFKVIEFFNFTGSIINVGSEKYRTIDIKRYFAHAMLRSELWNIEKNLLLYGGTIKYGGRVYIEIGPSPQYQGRLIIKTKTAWKKEDTTNTLDNLTQSFKLKTPPKITKLLTKIIDEKIEISKKLSEEKKQAYLEKRKKELEEKIEEEKRKLARLEQNERQKEEEEKVHKMKEWRLRNKLYPLEDLTLITWDKSWKYQFDMITTGITNVRIDSLEDEEYLRTYCDQIIDYIINLDAPMIRSDPEIKQIMMRLINDSRTMSIMKAMEPEPEASFGDDIDLRLRELVAQLPKTPEEPPIMPKPVPIDKLEEGKEKSKEREQKEVSLFE